MNSKNHQISKACLFDILLKGNDKDFNLFLNKNDLKNSIITEVTKLLNTKLSAQLKDYEKYKNYKNGLGLSFMYGVPDFNSIDIFNNKNHFKLCKIYEEAILYFESRIKEIKIKILSTDINSQSAVISIDAVIKKDNSSLNFSIKINS